MTLPISEQEFQTQVVDLARRFGWRYFHARPGMTKGGRWATQMSGDVGYPDLTLVRDDQLIFAELKSDAGTATDQQMKWFYALNDVEYVSSMLWRPHHLETVAELLSRR